MKYRISEEKTKMKLDTGLRVRGCNIRILLSLVESDIVH